MKWEKKDPRLSVAKDSTKNQNGQSITKQEEWHLRICSVDMVAVQTLMDGRVEKSFSQQTFRKCQLSWCWEGPFHIYYSRLSMADSSDFNAPCTANPLPIFPISISASSPVMHSSPLYLPLSLFWCVRTNHDLLGLRLWKDLWCRSRFL